MRRLLKNDLEFEVMGLHLTVRRIVGIAVLACFLVLAGLMVTELYGEDVGTPPINNTTGRYEEGKFNSGLCTVFIFLGLVILYFVSAEIRS